MPPDATDTKRRILAAARQEFAQYGLAGARVDRIAESADANKRSIYVHFGLKEELFDRVIVEATQQLEREVPFSADDLPGYAGRLFDFLIQDPDLARAMAWAQLERPEATQEELVAYATKVSALAHEQRSRSAGLANQDSAVDSLSLTLGLVTSWFSASPALRSAATSEPWSPERLREHRAAIIEAVLGLSGPARQPSTPTAPRWRRGWGVGVGGVPT